MPVENFSSISQVVLEIWPHSDPWLRVSVSGSVPRNLEPGWVLIPKNLGTRNLLWVPLFRNSGTGEPRTWNPSGFPVPRNPRTQEPRARCRFPFSRTWKPLVTCSQIEDRLYPDSCVSKNTEKLITLEIKMTCSDAVRK
jgi:hypothetical protein